MMRKIIGWKETAILPSSNQPWDVMVYGDDGALFVNTDHRPRIIRFDGTVEILEMDNVGIFKRGD
ncbi:MAG: hypothetical protein MI685_09500 [Chlorobiales bacterium]|nr:hypothetical protein [Chlorobiales bacterium]